MIRVFIESFQAVVIEKNADCEWKRDSMFAQIGSCFTGIPFKFHDLIVLQM